MAGAKKKNRGWLNFSKKKRKDKRNLMMFALLISTVAALVFFFVVIFSYLFPPTERQKSAEMVTAILFFPDAEEKLLVAEKRGMPKRNNEEEQAVEIVKALLAGSRAGGVRSFPPGVGVQSVKIRDAVATVSLGPELLKKHPGGTTAEMMTVFSLVNSLIRNNDKIAKVQIVVNGKPIATLKGHIDTSAPLSYREMSGGRER